MGSTGLVLGSSPLIYCAHPSPIPWVLSSSQGRVLGVVRRAPPRCPLGAVAPQNAVSPMRCRSHLLPFQPDLEVLSWGKQEKQEKIRRIGRKPEEFGENWENQAKIRRNQLCAVGRRQGSSYPHPSLLPLFMGWLPASCGMHGEDEEVLRPPLHPPGRRGPRTAPCHGGPAGAAQPLCAQAASCCSPQRLPREQAIKSKRWLIFHPLSPPVLLGCLCC